MRLEGGPYSGSITTVARSANEVVVTDVEGAKKGHKYTSSGHVEDTPEGTCLYVFSYLGVRRASTRSRRWLFLGGLAATVIFVIGLLLVLSSSSSGGWALIAVGA